MKLEKIVNYVKDIARDKGVTTVQLSNGQIATYYGVIRLSNRARGEFVGDIMRNGHIYGVKLVGDRGSYFIVEVLPNG